MSYKQVFHGTISGTVSGSRTVGPSQSSQTVHITLDWSEDIVTSIIVNTDPFDEGIDRVHGEILRLEQGIHTGAELQEQKIQEGATKVVETTTKGFNKLILSEIGQQVKELRARLDSQSALIVAEKRAAMAKVEQFDRDYNNIKGRYCTLFNKLNDELDRRIRALDQPVFQLVHQEFKERISQGLLDSPATTLLSTTEGSATRETLSRGWLIRSCQQVIRFIANYLLTQLKLRAKVQEVLLPRATEQFVPLALPMVLITTENATGRSVQVHSGFDDGGIGQPPATPEDLSARLPWQPGTDEALAGLNRELSRLMEEATVSGYSIREIEYIRQWWAASQPQTLES